MHSVERKGRGAEIVAEAGLLEEAVEQLVEGLSDAQGNDSPGEVVHSIETEADSIEGLVKEFLEEIVFLQDSSGAVVSKLQSLKVEDRELNWKASAEALVEPINPGMNVNKASNVSADRIDVETGDGWRLKAFIFL